MTRYRPSPDDPATKTPTVTISQAAEYTRDAVLSGLWDQREPHYQDPPKPCCIDAKLANFFGVSPQVAPGFDAFASLIGANRAQVILLLRQAAAGPNPKGSKTWPHSRRHVWDNLAPIDQLPSLEYADLPDANLSQANLSQADLSQADLTYAQMNQAILSWTDLRNANLQDADLRDSQTVNLNLNGANLTRAQLPGETRRE